MDKFLLALQFLTVIPVKLNEISEKKIAGSIIYFPVIGMLLGLILCAVNQFLLLFNLPPLALNTILVVSLIIITGGLHLDGLADTADAFLSGKPKEEMLKVLRDPHIGVMGVLSLISILLLKIALFSALPLASKITGLLLACILSRWSAVFLIFKFAYAREDGKAKPFFNEINSNIFFQATIIALIAALLTWGIKGLALLLIIAGSSYLCGKLASRKISGITGDIIGAVIELSEIVVLFTVALTV